MRRFLLPIRWRLALTSAALTFVILLGFAAVIAAFTASSLRSDFNSGLEADAADLASQIPTQAGLPQLGETELLGLRFASTRHAVFRVLASDELGQPPASIDGKAPLGEPRPDTFQDVYRRECDCDYRVFTKPIYVTNPKIPPVPDPVGFVQVGRDVAPIDSTIRQVDTFLALGVLVGTGLALLAGLAVARRAMTPIADLTYIAGHVSRTRDPSVTLPRTRANDEIADLSRTLEDMLKALDSAQAGIEATLVREREFVADASHELRTPLTSVLMNLELLCDRLEGEDEEMVESALRSTRRMRRLVEDLLFLANADAGRETAHERLDLGQVVRDAASETAPLSSTHEVRVEAPGGIYVNGAPDDLHRVVVNLIQNAVAHTPDGTIVRVRLRRRDGAMRPGSGGAPAPGEDAVLEVSDNGPGIPPEMHERIFERFARAPGATAGSNGSGLGLAIVHAVAEAHGGTVKLSDSPDGRTRFVVRMPTAGAPLVNGVPERGRPAKAPQTSTTTGSTRGRLFRRS